MKVIQGFCFMLAAVVGMLLVGAFMVNSASAGPRTAPLVALDDQCDATAGPCSTGQGINLTILPPGSTPPPQSPPPPTTAPPTTAQPGAGKSGTNAGTPNALPRTGPKETAIAAAVGFAFLQLGLIMSVRTTRAARRPAH